jgi:hypothetical protein
VCGASSLLVQPVVVSALTVSVSGAHMKICVLTIPDAAGVAPGTGAAGVAAAAGAPRQKRQAWPAGLEPLAQLG